MANRAIDVRCANMFAEHQKWRQLILEFLDISYLKELIPNVWTKELQTKDSVRYEDSFIDLNERTSGTPFASCNGRIDQPIPRFFVIMLFSSIFMRDSSIIIAKGIVGSAIKQKHWWIWQESVLYSRFISDIGFDWYVSSKNSLVSAFITVRLKHSLISELDSGILW